MRPFITALLLLGASTAVAADRADSAYGVMYDAEALVVDLPQDQSKVYVTLFGNPSDPKYKEITGWFDGHLKALKDASHFNCIPTNSVMWRDRYAKHVPVTPCLLVQSADGTKLYEAAGNSITMSPEALTRAINGTESFRKWCQPRQTTPNTDPPAQPLPPPAAPTPTPSAPVWPSILAVIVAAICGGGYGLYRQVSGKPRM